MTTRDALRLLDEIDRDPTLANMTRGLKATRAALSANTPVAMKLACLASFTIELAEPAIELQALRAGISAEIYVGPFGRAEQELIDAASGLTKFGPDAVIVAIRLQDACPGIYEAFNSLSADVVRHMIEDWHTRLRSALAAFRSGWSAPVLLQNYDLPAAQALGIADRNAPASQRAAINRANDGLADIASTLQNVYVMDYDALVARHGRTGWSDPRLAYYARMPVAPRNYWHLAGFYIRHLRPLVGLSRKVLVLDADNTLWGGVVGDVGLHEIALGQDYPGNAYVAFQRCVLDLYHRGVVLCLVSKNEPGIVEEVLHSHPEMILRREHFAAMRVNWEPKPANVEQIASDLNLGIDSFVFLDDSPVECEMMRTALPQVLTIQLPPEPAAFPGVIGSLDCFDQWSISDEDRRRGRLYTEEAGRRTLQKTAVDMPTFLRQLEMTMTIYTDHAPHVSRAAQMTRRTNQFNMHTVRCTEDDIRQLMNAEGSLVFTLALSDRFGDNGIVGLSVVHLGRDEWVLHMFLMSCRVLGRTVEQTFLGWIAEQACVGGASRLVGEFVPTAKNKPFVGFYESCGFVAAEAMGEVQRWTRSLDAADTTPPDWMEVKVTRSRENPD